LKRSLSSLSLPLASSTIPSSSSSEWVPLHPTTTYLPITPQALVGKNESEKERENSFYYYEKHGGDRESFEIVTQL
jgi:hypothetical protein